MMIKVRNSSGTTLVELMVALGIFTIFIAMMYPSFSFLTRQMTSMNDKQFLSETGHRIINYVAEEIRMSGFLIGSNPDISYCASTANSVSHTAGAHYDSLIFLTSIPIKTTDSNRLFLESSSNALMNDSTIQVNTSNSYIKKNYIDLSGSGNAKAIITFDTLVPSILQRAYELIGFPGTSISLSTGLEQSINTGSKIFSVRRKEILVNTSGGTRDLQIAGWDKNCCHDDACELNDDRIIENLYVSAGDNLDLGGIDVLRFEFTLNNNGVVTTVRTVTDNDLPYLKTVSIWMLFRYQFPSKEYTNSDTYSIGTINPATYGPYGDSFRRTMLRKTVEVKNLVF